MPFPFTFPVFQQSTYCCCLAIKLSSQLLLCAASGLAGNTCCTTCAFAGHTGRAACTAASDRSGTGSTTRGNCATLTGASLQLSKTPSKALLDSLEDGSRWCGSAVLEVVVLLLGHSSELVGIATLIVWYTVAVKIRLQLTVRPGVEGRVLGCISLFGKIVRGRRIVRAT